MKVCPFLINQAIRREHPIPSECMCLEEGCAWFIQTHQVRGCALYVATALAYDLAIIRFPSLAPHKR